MQKVKFHFHFDKSWQNSKITKKHVSIWQYFFPHNFWRFLTAYNTRSSETIIRHFALPWTKSLSNLRWCSKRGLWMVGRWLRRSFNFKNWRCHWWSRKWRTYRYIQQDWKWISVLPRVNVQMTKITENDENWQKMTEMTIMSSQNCQKWQKLQKWY